jgi:opacity protein-like surface antigen
MKTKLLVSLVALGVSSIAFAHGGMPKAMAANYFDGWYAGAGLGVQHQTATVDEKVSYTFNYLRDTTYTYPLKGDLGDNALNFGLFGGYGKVLNTDWYLGGELFARYAKANSSLEGGEGFSVTNQQISPISGPIKVELNSDYSYGGLVRGGYLITPRTMFYVLAGLEYTKFDVKINNTPQASFDLTPYSHSFSKGEFAFMPGVGLETMLNNNWLLRLQYTYAVYPSFSDSHSYKYEDTFYTAKSATKVDPSRGLFNIELGYRW